MSFTSIFPALGLTVLFLWIAKLIVRHSDFYQQAVQNSYKAKYKTLDGLRGFLALGVFFHHAVINYQYFQIGSWQLSPSRFYTFAGQGAVAFFFMITGFLFWSKIISGSRFKLKDFYLKRALRVLPAYWFSLAVIVVIVLIISGFSLKVSLPRFLMQIGSWLICGIYGLSNTNGEVFPDINHSSVGLINASVQWTLTYELQFYLILPLLVWFAKPSRFAGLFLTFLALSLTSNSKVLLTVMSFLFGMAAAYLVKRFESSQRLLAWQSSLGIVVLLVAVPAILPQPYIYNVGVIALLFCAFVLIACGNDLLGLLTASASRYLGTISYSVYLLHGIVFFIVLRLVNQLYPIQGMNPIFFWLLIGMCGLIVVSVSGLTYRYIEYPFLQVKTT